MNCWIGLETEHLCGWQGFFRTATGLALIGANVAKDGGSKVGHQVEEDVDGMVMANLPVGRGWNGADQALAGSVKAICNGWSAGYDRCLQPS